VASEIEISLTFKSIFKSKFYIWLRRSLPRYLCVAALLALALPAAEAHRYEGFSGRFFLALYVLTAVSLVLITAVSWVQAKRYENFRILLSFDDNGIVAKSSPEDPAHLFEWSSIGRGKESSKNIYLPENGILRKLLGFDLLGKRSGFFIPKPISESLRDLFKKHGKL
jgi:hypothetical protein